MREIIIKIRNKANISDEALYALSEASHKMWIEKGLDGPWLHVSWEEFRRQLQTSTVFVAVDGITGELLGMHCFYANKKQRRAFGFYLAVSPSAQREGIASRMLAYEAKRIRQAGFSYLKGITATNAEWSVRWHLKNGYRIIGYYHSPNDNFANYVFRKQLVPSILWDNGLYCRLRFLFAYTITHLTKDSRGQDNLIGRIARKVLRNRHSSEKPGSFLEETRHVSQRNQAPYS